MDRYELYGRLDSGMRKFMDARPWDAERMVLLLLEDLCHRMDLSDLEAWCIRIEAEERAEFVKSAESIAPGSVTHTGE